MNSYSGELDNGLYMGSESCW